MRVSRLGISFSLLYLLPTIACVAIALSPGDSKGRFVFLGEPAEYGKIVR
mgnify:FL=1